MNDLITEQRKLEKLGNYDHAIDKMQSLTDDLIRAREAIAANPSSAVLQVAKVKGRVPDAFREANSNLKQVNSALKGYEKALGKTFRTPFEEADSIEPAAYLVNRAVVMHLLREGQFNVATTFLDEAKEGNSRDLYATGLRSPTPHFDASPSQWEERSGALQKRFEVMYHILDELRVHHNLNPAIAWARENSDVLERRGSNLEFNLCRLRFVSLFLEDPDEGSGLDETSQMQYRIMRAGAYAREALEPFKGRYIHEIYQLVGAMAYWQNIPDSPYSAIFDLETAWDDVCTSFTREFCSLLGLSPSSPLYIACTAGAIALPVLAKVKTIMRTRRTEWTTQEELPVEIPLPPEFSFHSIFVCPVSKEQATDSNPPMMLPCGHVLCKESLNNVSRNSRFKCPYCPIESHPRDARKVFL